MRNLIAVTMAAALIASPAEAQQHGHGQAADSARSMMGMMGMMQGHCGMTSGGMMRSIMGGGMMGGGMMQGGMMQGGMMQGGMMQGGMMQGGMMQGGMMQDGMMGMAGGPGMILSLEETLSLTEDQVETLQRMKESADSGVQEHMMQGMEARQAATEILQSESPDLGTYEERLQEAANHMVLAHTVMARADLQARDELTEEQRQKLETFKGMMIELCRGFQGSGMMPDGSHPGSGQGR